MLRLQLIGFGAIGAQLCRALGADPDIRVEAVVVSHARLAGLQRENAGVPFTTSLDLGRKPDLVVECAGHSAIEQHVLGALRLGVPCLLVSVGALASGDLLERVRAAAAQGATQVQLLSGAVGGLDALGAAQVAGLDSVRYIGRKPPMAWRGTDLPEPLDLAALTAPTLLFRGSARAAAMQFPKNANVAATVALAGLGLDATEVELYADPGVSDNVHEIHAHGRAGQLQVRLQNQPLAANPKTSALTFYSIVRAVRQRAGTIVI
jgi:aspartate dehydrogenase